MLSRTCLSAISGTMSAAGASSESWPRSTELHAAAPWMALVIEAIQMTLSGFSTPARLRRSRPVGRSSRHHARHVALGNSAG